MVRLVPGSQADIAKRGDVAPTLYGRHQAALLGMYIQGGG